MVLDLSRIDLRGWPRGDRTWPGEGSGQAERARLADLIAAEVEGSEPGALQAEAGAQREHTLCSSPRIVNWPRTAWETP